MNSAERFYCALGGEIPDRVPTFTLGFDTKIIIELLLRLDIWPKLLRKLYRKINFYGNSIATVLEGVQFRSPETGQKPLMRRAFPLEKYTQSLWSMFVPSSYESVYSTLQLYLKTATGSKTDGTVLPGWPSFKFKGFVWQGDPDGGRYRKLVSEYNLATIFEEHGTPCAEDPVLPPNRQFQFLTEYFKDFDPTEQIQKILEPTLRNFEDKLGLVCWYSPGVYETWLETHGMTQMLPYFKDLFREYRESKRKPDYIGPFRALLEAKTDMFMRHMKQYAEIGGRAVGFGEDILTSRNAFIPPEVYEEFFIPYTRKCLDYARKLDLLTIFHTDGRWKQDNQDRPFLFLDHVAATKPNGIHGFQADCNNLLECKAHLESTRDSLDHSVVMVGGMDNNKIFSQPQSLQAIWKRTANVLQNLKLPGPFIAATDHSYHYGVLVENITQFNKAVWKYGRYD